MADIADRANEYMEEERQRSLAAMLAKKGSGKPECDCGEPISERRQELGATRCIDCQNEEEKKERGYGLL